MPNPPEKVVRRVRELDVAVLAARDREALNDDERPAGREEAAQALAHLRPVRAGVAAAGVHVEAGAGDEREAARRQRGR
jgi:hypothetical protein